tara:strand:+ start:1094 stop:2068 length:975 start_codon:yes stop_codon:yes gene_type:complete
MDFTMGGHPVDPGHKRGNPFGAKMDKLELNLLSEDCAAFKLIGLPEIIYRNHSEDDKKRKHMDDQFASWNVSNFKRHTNKYHADNYDEWKHLIDDSTPIIQTPEDIAYSINVLDSIITWYDESDSDTCIFMDDVVSFSPVSNWLFDWKFFEYHLPYNWDCMQLFASSTSMVKMHMHPWVRSNGGHQCFMITRVFAKKIKSLHFKDGVYKLYYDVPDKSRPIFEHGSLHSFFYDFGITYTFPIFCLDNDLLPDGKDINDLCDRVSSMGIKYWWRDRSKTFSNFELFHYNKGEDEWKMELCFDLKAKRPTYHYDAMDETVGLKIWI